ncbi:hypothetical protein FPL11_10030 [Spiribacter aquaticus]|uniref:Sulfotransferase n=1 Tax=Spiribacter aquaticus TaxID=1935996 RepID=A0A557RD06_9GAMM|nr:MULTISPECIES: hypothetical protein [Spiribacter]TVO63031.1 hypothetical protein FPL11_10030 [Spiribacter aquaticus]
MSSLKRSIAIPLTALSCLARTVNPQRNDNIFVVSGSPRAGTTWLAETLARTLNTHRVYWEPLQDGNIALPGALKTSKRPFIEHDNQLSFAEKKFFEDLLYGKQANSHLLRLKKYPRNAFTVLSSGPLLIKFVRGNGVLSYLHQQFEIPKPVVIIRHPCAVVASQLRMGRWGDHPHVHPKVLERYPGIRSVVSTGKPLHQRLAMTWAGDVLAARAQQNSVHVIYYEHLVQRGAEELFPVFEDWGLACGGLDEALRLPSTTARDWSDLTTVESKLGRWVDELSVTAIEEILETVSRMGITDYGKDPSAVAI